MEAAGACPHEDVIDGRCAACGRCLHEVVLNGVCYRCGATALEVTVKPPSRASLVPADRLRRR